MKGSRKKICLIDDDEISVFVSQKVIVKTALAENDEIISFYTGFSALDYFRNLNNNGDLENMPNLIFLDVNLKDITGWEFLDYFRKLNIEKDKQPTILMLSSSLYPRDKQRAETYEEVAGFIVKPLDMNKLNEIKTNYL